MRVASREGPGIAGANHMVAGAVFATACLKGPLRRTPAALDPRLLRQITHTNPRSPKKKTVSRKPLRAPGSPTYMKG